MTATVTKCDARDPLGHRFSNPPSVRSPKIEKMEMLMFHLQVRILLLGIAFASFTACKSSSSNGGTAASAQKLAVGSPCVKDSDCGSAPFYCMTEHPSGYCMRDCTTDADCPSEAICQDDGMKRECHRTCSVSSDCRPEYMCSPAANAADNKASHAFCDVKDTPDAGPSADAGGLHGHH